VQLLRSCAAAGRAKVGSAAVMAATSRTWMPCRVSKIRTLRQ